jgi:hypothetical protein
MPHCRPEWPILFKFHFYSSAQVSFAKLPMKAKNFLIKSSYNFTSSITLLLEIIALVW